MTTRCGVRNFFRCRFLKNYEGFQGFELTGTPKIGCNIGFPQKRVGKMRFVRALRLLFTDRIFSVCCSIFSLVLPSFIADGEPLFCDLYIQIR